ISIAKNGNTNPRITLYIAYHAPVRLTFIHLRARASVDTERLDAHVLQALGYFVHVFGVVVPAEACFNRHGQVGGFNHGFRHGRHLVNVLKQARPRTTASHVFNGAAVVDINQVGVYLRGYLGSLAHRIDITSENLYADRTLIFEDIQLLATFRRITNEALRRDKLRVHHIDTVFLTYVTKRRIAHVFHGREQ